MVLLLIYFAIITVQISNFFKVCFIKCNVTLFCIFIFFRWKPFKPVLIGSQCPSLLVKGEQNAVIRIRSFKGYVSKQEDTIKFHSCWKAMNTDIFSLPSGPLYMSEKFGQGRIINIQSNSELFQCGCHSCSGSIHSCRFYGDYHRLSGGRLFDMKVVSSYVFLRAYHSYLGYKGSFLTFWVQKKILKGFYWLFGVEGKETI